MYAVAEAEIDLRGIGTEVRRATQQSLGHDPRRVRRCDSAQPRQALRNPHPYQLTLSLRAILHVAVHAQRVARAQSDNLSTVRREDGRGVVGRHLAHAHRLASGGIDEPHVTRIARIPAHEHQAFAVWRPTGLEPIGDAHGLRVSIETHAVDGAEGREGQRAAVRRLHGCLNDAHVYGAGLLAQVLTRGWPDRKLLPHAKRNLRLRGAGKIDPDDPAAEIRNHSAVVGGEFMPG